MFVLALPIIWDDPQFYAFVVIVAVVFGLIGYRRRKSQ
jgi:hypothetical protein